MFAGWIVEEYLAAVEAQIEVENGAEGQIVMLEQFH